MQTLHTDERGSTLITVAITLTVLIAFLALALDVGLAYSERRKMQNAADAAALAGATLMARGKSDSEINNVIQQYAVAENQAQSYDAVYLPSLVDVGSGSVPADATGIRVDARTTFPTFFAGILGFNTLSAVGTAGGGFGPLDMVMVLDKSGSMDDDSCSWGASYPGPPACPLPINQFNCTLPSCGGVWTLPPQPMEDAKTAADYFVDLNNPIITQIGLVTYSDSGTLDRPMTANYSAVKTGIDSQVPAGCTNATDALAAARAELTGPRARSGAQRIMIFMTDGLPNLPECPACPDYCPAAQASARNQAQLAAGEGIVIYSIGLGEKADQALLQEMADLTGGGFFYAPTSAQLQAAYQDIFERIRLRLIQ